MSPRRTTVEHSKGVFEVEWPLFGELSRGLALKVARAYDPEVVVGIATAGVVPGGGHRGDPRPRVPLDGREPALRHGLGARDAGRPQRRAGVGPRTGAC